GNGGALEGDRDLLAGFIGDGADSSHRDGMLDGNILRKCRYFVPRDGTDFDDPGGDVQAGFCQRLCPAQTAVERMPLKGDERAQARPGGDQPSMLKLGQGLSNGGARNAELFRQLVFTGEFEARLELAAADPVGERLHYILSLRHANRYVHVYTGTPRGDGDANLLSEEYLSPTPRVPRVRTNQREYDHGFSRHPNRGGPGAADTLRKDHQHRPHGALPGQGPGANGRRRRPGRSGGEPDRGEPAGFLLEHRGRGGIRAQPAVGPGVR